jgi:hypothetical protein
MLQVDDQSEIHNSLLHFMHGAEHFSITLNRICSKWQRWCPFLHGNKISLDCYFSNQRVANLLNYVEKYLLCCKYLVVRKYTVDQLRAILSSLKNPATIVYNKDFGRLICRLKDEVTFADREVSDKVIRLTCMECEKLDEALVCYSNYCFYASVVMAVSAVETRIHEMVKKANLSLYSKYFKNATLGHLLQVFDDDHYKEPKFKRIKNLLPAKHRPLVTLLNLYRVFSAHPKGEIITAQLAESVLNLCFAFVTDPAISPYTSRELHCIRKRALKLGAIAIS